MEYSKNFESELEGCTGHYGDATGAELADWWMQAKQTWLVPVYVSPDVHQIVQEWMEELIWLVSGVVVDQPSLSEGFGTS